MTSDSTSTVTIQPDRRQPRGGDGVGLFFVMILLLAVMIGAIMLMVRQAQEAGERRERAARIESLTARGAIPVRVSSAEPELLAPDAPAWHTIPAVAVRVGPQNMAMPMLDQPTIDQLLVQTLATPTRIALRLSWDDQTPDMSVDAGRFSDAVAVQLPLAPDPVITMGTPQGPVQILLWKAIWQKDIDERFQDVQDLHPNYWADQYWFAKPATDRSEESKDYRVPDSFQDPAAQAYFPARQAGNPVAQWTRSQPVEELTAEGFGTLSTQRRSVAQGRGFWKNGRWTVTIVRPLLTDDAFDHQFHAVGQVAFAVWDGAAGNVGGRKHYSQWIPFEIVR